eukprot:526398-Hanusia_phi.AAC.1
MEIESQAHCVLTPLSEMMPHGQPRSLQLPGPQGRGPKAGPPDTMSIETSSFEGSLSVPSMSDTVTVIHQVFIVANI